MKFFRSRKDRAQSQEPEKSEEAGASGGTPPSGDEITPNAGAAEAEGAADSGLTSQESGESTRVVDASSTQLAGDLVSVGEGSDSSEPSAHQVSAVNDGPEREAELAESAAPNAGADMSAATGDVQVAVPTEASGSASDSQTANTTTSAATSSTFDPTPVAASSTTTSAATTETAKEPGFFSRLKRGLGRTSENLVTGIGNLFLGKKEIDADLLEELESQLIMADVGIEATADIVSRLTDRVSRKELADGDALMEALQQELHSVLAPCEAPLDVSASGPFVILVVGVNGVGKTTTIGKMARRFKDEGRSVMLAAGDTFRAAAVEQLQHWGERNDVPVIAQHTGADSASVIYDALQAATARNVDVLIADTAGRLQNKSHLMDELSKVVRVMGKINEHAPHEVMLVLDAGTGQNALSQATQFGEVVGVTGVTLTKLDGTAKGGVIFAIAQRLKLPIRFIGVGESAEDLRPFVASDFIRALFQRS